MKFGEHAFIVQSNQSINETNTTAAVDSDGEEIDTELVNLHMTDVEYKYESSIYSSSSDGSESYRGSPVLDDANREYKTHDSKNIFIAHIFIFIFFVAVFLTEVIDSLERGFKEKTNPDFLILEINSSRYAYNMSLAEVNFYVVKALLNLYPVKESNGNVLSAFNQIFAHLNGVLKHYIRGSDAMGDCLKAIEVSIVFLQSNLNILAKK